MKNLLNPDKADLDNDGKLSSYEKKRGMAIEESMKERKNYLEGDMVSEKNNDAAFKNYGLVLRGVQGVPQQPTQLGPTGTGGGNIGIGNVPVAGEDTFSGTIGAAGPAGEGSPE